jgi:rare lipoprotein A
MIFTTRKLYSSIGLLTAMLVATALFLALPSLAQDQSGVATWTNINEHGRKTASGERYDHRVLTAAHGSLPFDSMVRVVNADTEESVVVRINDRMSGELGAVISLSGAAARQVGLHHDGPAEVSLLILDLEQSVIVAAEGSSTNDQEDIRTVPMNTGASMANVVPTVPEPTPATGAATGANETVQDIEMTSWFTLQIGSFGTLDGAEELAGGYAEAWVREVDTDAGAIYRVYFSRFDTVEPARSAQNRLWADG